jgi:hypothetical protein
LVVTTEAGGGVPGGELVERLAYALVRYRSSDKAEPSFLEREEADAILAEIAAARFELVPRERMDRLLEFAEAHHNEYCQPWGHCLQDGDLDRPEGRE